MSLNNKIGIKLMQMYMIKKTDILKENRESVFF